MMEVFKEIKMTSFKKTCFESPDKNVLNSAVFTTLLSGKIKIAAFTAKFRWRMITESRKLTSDSSQDSFQYCGRVQGIRRCPRNLLFNLEIVVKSYV